MEILVITREFPPHVLGGLSYHLAHLYGEIAKDHDVTVVAGKCDVAMYEEVCDLPDDLEVQYVRYRSPSAYHVRFPARLLGHLRTVDVERFDVAFTHTEVPFDLGVPTISKFHDCKYESHRYARQGYSFFRRILDGVIDPTRTLVNRRALDRAGHHIFISEIVRDCWYGHNSWYDDHTILHNGVDTSLFYPRDVPQEDFYLFVGACERKGLSRVLRFASDTGEDVVIVGAVDEPVPPSVTIRGRVDQSTLAELYSRARATIHPANFEAFGNIVLESLACGTPVVTTGNCGASEILTESAGVVTDDIADGVGSIDRCSPEECTAVAKRYSWSRVAARTVDVAERIA